MAKKPCTNTTDQIMHVGNTTIWPGQTREVDETLLPDYAAPDTDDAAPDPDADLKALLEGNVGEVREALPAFTDDELDSLEALESEDAGGKGRKGVLEAIAEARLQRAVDADLDAFKESLQDLDEEALLAKLDEVGGDVDRQNLVQAAVEALDTAGDGES